MSSGARIGLVGCGRWGQHILRDLNGLGCQVVVATPSPESQRRAAERGAAAVVCAAEDLPDVAGVVVAAPTTLHAPLIERLLGRGVPIFTEKPLSADAASARRIADRAGGRLFVMDKWRYHPGIEALGQIARGGELGPVCGMRLTQVGWGCPHQDVDAIWILAPHCLSIALEVLGHVPEPTAAFADLIGGEPVGLVGCLGDEPRVVLEVSARSPDKRREFRLHCRDGVAWLDDATADHVKVIRGSDPWDSRDPQAERRAVSTEMPLLRELRAFLDHLGGGPPPRSSAAEGARAVEIIAALRRLAGLPPGEVRS